MADDVFSAFSRGFTAFAHSHAGTLVQTSFKDAASLTGSLVDGRPGTTKPAFEQLRDSIKATGSALGQLKKAIDDEITKGKEAVTEMAAELARPDFDLAAAARALTALGKLLVAYDTALDKIAEEISKKPGTGISREDIRRDISGMNGPFRNIFNTGSSTLAGAFDQLCSFVLGVDDASAGLAEKLKWDYAAKKLTLEIGNAGPSGDGVIAFDGGSLEAYFTYQTEFKAGLVLKTKVQAGLRGDKFLEKIMPGGGNAEVNEVMFSLDTKDGAGFGAGKDKRMVLPVRFTRPGIELREFAVEQPAQDNENGKNRINFVVTVAGKLGDTFACVVEGGGISVRWRNNDAPEVTPKIPTGAGLRLKTPAVTGGGYLRYDEVKKEYGGVLQLELAKIGITAIGLLGTEPFSLVIVIGVRFLPKIELGFGFTLSGLGGILAIERTLNSDALRDGLSQGVVSQLLFPEDPVAAAPQILNSLGAIFPAQPGGFVIGPMAELGWGSQAGFIKAKVGVVLSLPNPKIAIIGNLQVGVPSADLPEETRIIDLRADLFGEITEDYFYFKVSLSKSRIFVVNVTGDIAIYIGWGGDGAMAFSAGGFFPGFEAPDRIGKLNRLRIGFDAGKSWLTIGVEAYVAVTSNSVQFGGKVNFEARIKPFVATAWIQIDAMFAWSPVFCFTVRLDAGIKVSAYDVTLFGVSFRGELSGDKPFRLQGNAEVTILFWDIPVDIGPITWGNEPAIVSPDEDPMTIAAAALNNDAAWSPRLPADAQSLVRLIPDETPPTRDPAAKPPRLYHPLGAIELRQISVPLEMDIDRIGSGKAVRRRINLAAPKLNSQDAGAVWPLSDRFPPGHFLNLSDAEILSRPPFEERVSGLGMGPAHGASFGDAVHAAMVWNTVLPGQNKPMMLPIRWEIGKSARRMLETAGARVVKANPYAVPKKSVGPVVADGLGPVSLAGRGTVTLALSDSLAAAPGYAGLVMPASDAAAAVALAGEQGIALTTIGKGFV